MQGVGMTKKKKTVVKQKLQKDIETLKNTNKDKVRKVVPELVPREIYEKRVGEPEKTSPEKDTPNPFVPRSDPAMWERMRQDMGIPDTRAEMDKRLGPGKSHEVLDFDLLTGRSKKALERANRYREQLGDKMIGTEHILLGLMADEDGGIAAHLMTTTYGISLSQMIKSVEEILNKKLS